MGRELVSTWWTSVKSLTPTPPSEPLKPSTGAAVRDHRNAVRDRSESLSAIDRNHCPHSPESAMLDRNPDKKMSELRRALPKTWQSPTMSPHCADEVKYGVIDQVVKHFEAARSRGEMVAGQKIRDLVTVNGVRVTVEDGTWGLARASSNKPELVVVRSEEHTS